MDQPTLLVDLEQAKKNLALLQSRIPEGCGIRLASKSIRSPDLLKFFLKELGPAAVGVMCYHPDEIKFLHSQGIENILLAYPVYTPEIAKRIASHQKEIENSAQKMFLMVDVEEHLKLLRHAAREQNTRLDLIVDVDVSTRFPGLHFGVHRSSLCRKEEIVAFIKSILDSENLNFCGLMSYEAQIAGIADNDPRENFLKSWIMRTLKRIAMGAISKQRTAIKRFLTQELSLDLQTLLLNGGGSGSVESTAKDELINEITIGSGVLCPALFENYQGLPLKPALCFGLPVVRKPNEAIRTLYGGGYIASGAHSRTKQPKLFCPAGWAIVNNEGFGEVQTPLVRLNPQAKRLEIGDSAYFLPAKSGETMERFKEIRTAVFSDDIQILKSQTFKTYRGMGECFG